MDVLPPFLIPRSRKSSLTYCLKMANDNDPILLDDYQEIFWMLVTFFAMNADNQQDTIKIFSTNHSGTLNEISSKVLGDLADCYTTYFPEVESIYEPALELYWLFKLMGTHGFYESKMDFPVAQI